MASLAIPPPDNSRQLAFHELLVVARRDWLIDAVNDALQEVDPNRLRSELATYVPPDVHVLLAVAGLPDEYVCPLPVVLEAKPTLVGYYRLLLGLPRKPFYASANGMGKFKLMEEKGILRSSTIEHLPEFCKVMTQALADMVRQLTPVITRRDLIELPVMTLGQQFQGANNNAIGNEAINGVFRSIRKIVEPHITEERESSITISNSAGQVVRIILSTDPDVGIEEDRDGKSIRRLALEVKGGSDWSNQHNRIGEAEKSHIKAKASGYSDFWTIIRTKTLERPSTISHNTAVVRCRAGT